MYKRQLSVAKIDVFDNEQLGQAISQLSSLCGDAAQQIAIQKIQSQISSRRNIEPGESLLSLTGDASVISVMLAIASGLDSQQALKELAKSDKELAAQFQDLVDLINGKVNDWNKSINAGEDGLSEARRRFAWLNFTDEVENLSPSKILAGIELLETIPNSQLQVQNLKWIHLSALAASGKSEDAAETLVTYSLDNAIDIDNLYQLVSQLSSPAVEDWLKSQLNVLDEGALVYIAQHETSSLDLRNECFKICLLYTSPSPRD